MDRPEIKNRKYLVLGLLGLVLMIGSAAYLIEEGYIDSSGSPEEVSDRPSEYCETDSDCYCKCCQPQFNASEATAGKLNNQCSLRTRDDTTQMNCAFDKCSRMKEDFDVRCVQNRCVWEEK